MNIAEKYRDPLKEFVLLQQRVRHIHPFLNKCYPIAIIEDGYLNIFDYDPDKIQYKLEHREPDSMNTPKGVRAAFPLKCYDNRATVVVSGEVFDTISDRIILFHECTHCYQFETCESRLREGIELARKSVNSDRYFWELHYPFPYEDGYFGEYAQKLIVGLNMRHAEEVYRLRKEIKNHLTKEQSEYMVWQEWKEGFARYIENVIKRELGVKENHFGIAQPYSRPFFYESGSRLIGLVNEKQPEAIKDIERLYHLMDEDNWL